MNVKINEKGGRYGLWVTEKPGDTEPPIFTAQNRSAEQILALLAVILASPDEATPAAKAHPKRPAPRIRTADGTNEDAFKAMALYTMLTTLDGWIQGAIENHEALDHRNESTGEECWRSFAPADIRSMINDAARSLGLAEFPTPKVALEDK